MNQKQGTPRARIQFKEKNDYFTPKHVVDYFGKFDYDPATTKLKAEELGIKNYDTIETDGLKANWNKYKKIWINPPFTIKDKFLKKAYETYSKANNDIYILLPIEFLVTKNFTNISRGFGGKIFIPSGRICFNDRHGKKERAPAFGSIILKVQNSWEIELIDF